MRVHASRKRKTRRLLLTNGSNPSSGWSTEEILDSRKIPGSDCAEAQKSLWEILETGAVRLLELGEADVSEMKGLMEKYRDLPMDMADTALVHVAIREGIRRVLTVDKRDFSIYRLPRKGSFTLLP